MRKKETAADTRHKNAIAAINAQRIMKHYQDLDLKSHSERITYLTELRNEKLKELEELKGVNGLTLTISDHLDSENKNKIND